MLRWRLLLGPVLIAVLAAIFWFDAQFGRASPVLLAFSAVLVARASWELVHLLSTRSFAPSGWRIFLASLVVMAANWLPWTSPGPGLSDSLGHVAPALLVLVLCGMVLFALRALAYTRPGGSLETLAIEWLSVFYLGGMLSLTAQLRWIRLDLGYLPLASLVIVAKIADTAAFTAGKIIGGPKLIPLLSPGKTWAGAVGGIAGAALGGWGLFALTAPWFSTSADATRSLVYGLVVGSVSELGDLCESLIKRDVGQKDSAPMLPGFGGLLDLLDSVLFAGPAAYALWLLWPPLT